MICARNEGNKQTANAVPNVWTPALLFGHHARHGINRMLDLEPPALLFGHHARHGINRMLDIVSVAG